MTILKVIEYEAGKRAVGIKCISFNEPQFGGHFPERPIMPGVMQVVDYIFNRERVLRLVQHDRAMRNAMTG